MDVVAPTLLQFGCCPPPHFLVHVGPQSSSAPPPLRGLVPTPPAGGWYLFCSDEAFAEAGAAPRLVLFGLPRPRPALLRAPPFLPQPSREAFLQPRPSHLVGRRARPVVCRSEGGSTSLSRRYASSLKNLSTLQLMGTPAETRNYISVTTSVLSRWAEDGSPSCGLWPRIQDALVSALCTSASPDQV